MPKLAQQKTLEYARSAISDTEERGSRAECMERIAFAMHEMCQPLMALQCRLEIGRMMGTATGYEEAVREGLAECDRLLISVDALREEVRCGLDSQPTL